MPAKRASRSSGASPAKQAKKNDDGLSMRIAVVGGSEVLVGTGLFARVPDEIEAALAAEGFKASKYVIISDENVWALYGERLVALFEAKGISPLHYAIKPGEKSKDRRVKEAVEDYMLKQRCVRDTVVVALGGGVVGDLSGFVASTYLRGIPVFQVPTSVMAMVDSSVGGKTAVNVPAGKNLVGAFHQPRRIFVDTDLLKSLSKREIAEGLAEVIKMGVIRCTPLFEAMEANPVAIMGLDAELLAHVVGEAIRLKAEVVALDEKEVGVRSTLNFGHTVGHAIEAILSPKLLHGECVSIGMAIEACLARDLGELTTAAVGRITRCLKAYGLPVALPAGLKVADLLDKMKLDKKNAAGAVRCTVVTGIGSSHDTPQPVKLATLERLLTPALTVVPPAYGSLKLRIRVPGSKSISNRVLLMAALGEGPCRLRGLLHSEALCKIGCDIEHLEAKGSLPLLVRARGLPGGKITLSGKVSSQFVSSVLLSAPYAREAIELTVPEAVSQQYIEMTLQLMERFGVKVEREGNTVYRVPKGDSIILLSTE
ncbi:hypothetical protein T492DRAFT_899489 [Pavlovales sp. CCMP2436]|nr:hypothetical protein T492DRAFT_899489 [Pavlovales sp. CCMP2436]